MFRVGSAFDGQIRRGAHLLAKVELEDGEIGNCAIVHEAMSTKDERVIVDGGDWRPTGCTDMGHEHASLSVRADRTEVQIVRGRLDALVHGRS